MSAPSPPKPWETSGGATSASVGESLEMQSAPIASNTTSGLTGSSSTTTPAASTTAGAPPPLPSVPDSLGTVANRNASTYSNMNRGYGASPYSSYGGGYNSYSSPYSSFGGMGSMYGGGYGGMYGGMGGMSGMGMGGMYGGMGMPGDPNNPQSLTQSFSQSTQATFQLIENIVGAFGGFAQMLQSTYMATHSSFFGTFSRTYEAKQD